MPLAARQMLQIKLAGMGEILASTPARNAPTPPPGLRRLVIREIPRADSLRLHDPDHLRQGQSHTGSAKRHTCLAFSGCRGASRATRSNVSSAPVAGVRRDAAAKTEAAAAAPTGSSENILRVEAERIDNVLDLVGELILAKSMLQQGMPGFPSVSPRILSARASVTLWPFRRACSTICKGR